MLAVEATRRWSGDGIYANAVNPGAIATALAAGQAALPRPGQAGRHVAIPARQPGGAGLNRPGCDSPGQAGR